MAQLNRWWRFGLPIVALVSLFSAVLADFFFYDQIVGWTLGGFVGWLLLLLVLRNGRAMLTGKHWVWGWSLVIMTLGLCVSLVLEPGTIAVVLSIMMLTTLAMLAHGWTNRALGWRWLWELGWSWLMVFTRPVRDSRVAKRWVRRTQSLRGRVSSAARLVWALVGIAIPLLLSLVFLGLFALANPVVSDWMSTGTNKVGDFFSNLTDYITVSRMVLWYFAAFVCWGLLRHRPKRTSRIVKLGRSAMGHITGSAHSQPHTSDAYAGEENPHPVAEAASKKREADGEEPGGIPLETVAQPEPKRTAGQDIWAWLAVKYTNLIVRCLVAMNLVFALQLVLDSRYLVLGSKLPEGMGYAEYAQRGAYPLIATAILAAALVLAVFRPGGIAQRSKLAVWLVLIWIAQNIVLVISAAWRLQAYVEIYTLTRLRVAAGVWMLMVAGCLALLLWRIARSRDNTWLTAWAMGWGIAVLWVCSFVPFDPMIAGYNVRNCKEMGGQAGVIDVGYLEQLGPDALPAVAYLIENMTADAAARPANLNSARTSEGVEDAAPDPPLVWYDSDYEPGFDRDYDRSPDVVPLAIDVYTLGEELVDLRARLSSDLAEQLDGWRGWTVRRAWLEQSTGE
ncbi:MAG: DUF4173 domain-containing protein [Phycisphaeraceae bacterium]